MSVRWFEFEAVDTFFFRDGRPFNQGEGAAGAVGGTFPPPASTVVGALRAAFARSRGWRSGAWDLQLQAVLGNGTDLGPLRVTGPHLRLGNELILRAPLHVAVVAQPDGSHRHLLLRPGAEVRTDLGLARLPEAPPGTVGAKPLEDHLVSWADMTRLLSGELTDLAPLEERELYSREVRTGIHREDVSSRTTGDNALFTTVHTRPRDGLTITVGLEGLPADWGLEPSLVPVGGESRGAWLRELDLAASPPVPLVAPVAYKRYTVTLLTPALLPSGALRPGGTIPGLPGTLVSACVGRAVKAGGWNGAQRSSTPLVTFLPAGSTFFLRSDEALGAEQSEQINETRIGDRTAWGFGQVAVGTWREE